MLPRFAYVLVAALVVGAVLTSMRHFIAAPAVEPASPVATPDGTAAAALHEASTAAPRITGSRDAADPQRPVRDVTPPGIARVFMPPPAAPSNRGPATTIQITRAGVMPDGSISGDGGSVRLYGVAFPDMMKICAIASGERWACGRRATIALHNKLADQTVNCAPRLATEPPAADCFVGEVNLAAWLLAQGLVRVVPDVTDNELLAAQDSARRSRLGLWLDVSEAAAAAGRQGP
jgi:endonuclease YncB( thermonuclease family)